MFKFVLRLLFIQATLLSQNTYHMEDLVLIRFITAFKDEKTIDNWMNATNKIALCEPDLFKDIINKVCSVLNMMATEREIDMKPLFMKTDISLKNVVYPYYETFIVISSVKRILFLNDTKSEAWNENNLPKDILYKEFYMIYISLRLTTEQIWFRYNYTDLSMSYLELKNIKDSKLEDKKTTEDLFKRINFTKISTGFLDSLFPTLKDTPVFVEAHKDGFRKSRKCIDKEILFDIRDGSKEFFEESMLRYLKQYSIKQSSKTIYKLRKHMDTQFSCNKTAAKVIVMLFHYLSEIKGKNTRYEISLQENNKYRIKWSYSKKPSLKAVKKYIMQQEIQDPCSIKKFNGIGPIGEYKTNYYTVKTNDNKNKGIETRLIVLSCGHQLGFDLIDKFLRNFYMNYSERLQCPTCKCFISILGCYDAIVYKCNENSSFCAII